MLDNELTHDLVNMAEFDEPKHSKREVVNAGKLLARNIYKVDDDVREAFKIAHNWRSAYAYPMHRLRHELRGKIARGGGKGITAGRLKRMISIRRKLSSGALSLYQMQDIAGVRAVLSSIDEVNRISGLFEDGATQHRLVRTDDYLIMPRESGYRSRHLILKYTGDSGDEVFNRQFVEIQLRTERQHAWATSVESVGLVTGDNLKGGEGNPDWLRFFKLMSAEIAEREGLPADKSAPKRNDRLVELRALNKRLGAIQELESYKEAIHYTDAFFGNDYRYVLMSFNRMTKTVTVRPYIGFRDIDEEYERIEGGLLPETVEDSNAVLVEVDRVRDLKSAYPNYFLDVQLFVSECRKSLSGRGLSVDDQDFTWLCDWKKTVRR